MIQTQILPINITRIVWGDIKENYLWDLESERVHKKQEPMGSYYTSANS